MSPATIEDNPEGLVKHKMAARGIVYLLMNPALPNLVKIGKTQGTAEERARQLSGTGVPASFVVVYKKDFNDCDSAERFVHTLLETRGYRVAANREFFEVPVPVAIEAMLAAHSYFATHAADVDKLDESSSVVDGFDAQFKPSWEPLMNAALSAQLGWEDEIKDESRAAQLYQQAAKLGAPDSFLALADLYGYGINGGRADRTKAIEWLLEGTRHGATWCWASLADAYSGKAWSDLKQPDNARKCLRNFFAKVDCSKLDDSEQRVFFFRLKEYVAFAAKASDMETPRDLNTIIAAGDGLSRMSTLVVNDLDRTARLKSIDGLIEWAMRALAPHSALSAPPVNTASPSLRPPSSPSTLGSQDNSRGKRMRGMLRKLLSR